MAGTQTTPETRPAFQIVSNGFTSFLYRVLYQRVCQIRESNSSTESMSIHSRRNAPNRRRSATAANPNAASIGLITQNKHSSPTH